MTDRSQPRSLTHYRIISKLGAGGMGEVYLANDTRLNRNVAIKLLPAELTRNADSVRRFMQEAKAASALNHPNIITVHDIGESDDGHFIVMELVSGETLRSVLGAEVDDSYFLAYWSLALIHLERGAFEESARAAEKAHSLAPWSLLVAGNLAGVLTRSGNASRAAAVLRKLGDGTAYGAPLGACPSNRL